MDKMTNGERIAYAHGRVKSDIDDIRETAAELHQGIQAAHRAWLIVLVSGLVALAIFASPLFIFPHLQWYKYVYVAASIMVFLVARLVSYHRIQDVLKTAYLADSVIHSLSNSQTLHIGFEGIQQFNKEQIRKMTPQGLADSLRELCLDIKSNLSLIGAHVDDLQKMADKIASINVIDPHWLAYPLDRLAPITGEFGTRWTIGGKAWVHEGIDFGIESGSAVRACADGKVIFAGVKDGYGNCVRIEHDYHDEKWWTWYGHLSVISVLCWTRVKADELIGLSGATGNVTGPHLHLTVQRASCDYKPDGCKEALRGVVNPRDWVKWPI